MEGWLARLAVTHGFWTLREFRCAEARRDAAIKAVPSAGVSREGKSARFQGVLSGSDQLFPSCNLDQLTRRGREQGAIAIVVA